MPLLLDVNASAQGRSALLPSEDIPFFLF
jgi:hypothetical protein